jgi:hypothetical protein
VAERSRPFVSAPRESVAGRGDRIRLIDRGFRRRVCFEGTKGCGDPRSSRSIQVKVNELLRSSSVLHCPVVTLLASPRVGIRQGLTQLKTGIYIPEATHHVF